MMDDCNDSDDFVARRLLSEFANQLHEECQCQPVRLVTKQKGRLLLIESVQLAEGGLNLMLEERGLHFIAMENIGRNTFYRKHHDPYFIVPPWL
jgi:hypothetical protein